MLEIRPELETEHEGHLSRFSPFRFRGNCVAIARDAWPAALSLIPALKAPADSKWNG